MRSVVLVFKCHSPALICMYHFGVNLSAEVLAGLMFHSIQQYVRLDRDLSYQCHRPAFSWYVFEVNLSISLLKYHFRLSLHLALRLPIRFQDGLYLCSIFLYDNWTRNLFFLLLRLWMSQIVYH